MTYLIVGALCFLAGYEVASIFTRQMTKAAFEASDGWAESNRMWAEDVAKLTAGLHMTPKNGATE